VNLVEKGSWRPVFICYERNIFKLLSGIGHEGRKRRGTPSPGCSRCPRTTAISFKKGEIDRGVERD